MGLEPCVEWKWFSIRSSLLPNNNLKQWLLAAFVTISGASMLCDVCLVRRIAGSNSPSDSKRGLGVLQPRRTIRWVIASSCYVWLELRILIKLRTQVPLGGSPDSLDGHDRQFWPNVCAARM